MILEGGNEIKASKDKKAVPDNAVDALENGRCISIIFVFWSFGWPPKEASPK